MYPSMHVSNVAHPNSVAQVSNFLCWQVDKMIQLEPLSIGRPIYFCCLSKCTYTVLFCGAFAVFAVHIQNFHWPKFTFNRDKTPQQTAYLAIWRALVLHCAFISNTNIITSHLSSTKTTLNWFATIICATVLEETIPFAPPPHKFSRTDRVVGNSTPVQQSQSAKSSSENNLWRHLQFPYVRTQQSKSNPHGEPSSCQQQEE